MMGGTGPPRRGGPFLFKPFAARHGHYRTENRGCHSQLQDSGADAALDDGLQEGLPEHAAGDRRQRFVRRFVGMGLSVREAGREHQGGLFNNFNLNHGPSLHLGISCAASHRGVEDERLPRPPDYIYIFDSDIFLRGPVIEAMLDRVALPGGGVSDFYGVGCVMPKAGLSGGRPAASFARKPCWSDGLGLLAVPSGGLGISNAALGDPSFSGS